MLCIITGMMYNTQSKPHKRINITLPENTIALVDRIAKKGSRSRLIDEAVRFYVEQKGAVNLRELLKEGAIVRAKRDTALSEEWFLLEEEVCQAENA